MTVASWWGVLILFIQSVEADLNFSIVGAETAEFDRQF